MIIIIFFFKTIYYSLRSIGLAHVLELSPDTVYEIQSMDNIKALHHEIAEKMWEYDQIIPYNNNRLFNYGRGQRNLIFGMIFFLILGLLFAVNAKIQININIQYLISLIMIFFTIISDLIFEKFGFWEFN